MVIFFVWILIFFELFKLFKLFKLFVIGEQDTKTFSL